MTEICVCGKIYFINLARDRMFRLESFFIFDRRDLIKLQIFKSSQRGNLGGLIKVRQ